MRAVDTNVLVRLIVRDDTRQVGRAEAFVINGAWVSTLVLAETVWVLQSVYDLDADKIATTVAMLLEHDQLVFQDPETVRAALEQFQRQSAVEFTDCLVIAIAEKAGHVPVGTFDKAMSQVPYTQRV